MLVKLITNDCPKCKVLEEKLKQKNIEYDISYDIMKYSKKYQILSAPILEINDKGYDFSTAINWVNNYEN